MKKEQKIQDLQGHITNLRIARNNDNLTRRQNLMQETNRQISNERRLRTETENELQRINAQLESIRQQNLELQQQLQASRQLTIATNPTDGETDVNRHEPRTVHINSPEFGSITLNQRIHRTAASWDTLIDMALAQYNVNTEEAIRTTDYAFYDVRTHIRRGPGIVGGFLRQNHVLNLVRRDFITSGTPYMLSIPENPTTFPSIGTSNNESNTTTISSGLPRGTNRTSSSTRLDNSLPQNHGNNDPRLQENRRIHHRERLRQQPYHSQHRRYNREHRN
jgi:hypothetical protein